MRTLSTSDTKEVRELRLELLAAHGQAQEAYEKQITLKNVVISLVEGKMTNEEAMKIVKEML